MKFAWALAEPDCSDSGVVLGAWEGVGLSAVRRAVL